MRCPFCNEDDFDKMGLKYHLENYCLEYKNMPDVNNLCYQCEYRKPDEQEYINICLLDESKGCVRDER